MSKTVGSVPLTAKPEESETLFGLALEIHRAVHLLEAQVVKLAEQIGAPVQPQAKKDSSGSRLSLAQYLGDIAATVFQVSYHVDRIQYKVGTPEGSG